MEPLPEIKKGRYRHFKGGLYLVEGVARHSETTAPMVLYRHERESDLWVRPFAMFFEEVEHEGVRVPRFRYEGEIS